jgi:hypothetical protein
VLRAAVDGRLLQQGFAAAAARELQCCRCYEGSGKGNGVLCITYISCRCSKDRKDENREGFGGFNKESCIALSIKKDVAVTDIDHPIREKKKEGCILCRALELAALEWVVCWLVYKQRNQNRPALESKPPATEQRRPHSISFSFTREPKIMYLTKIILFCNYPPKINMHACKHVRYTLRKEVWLIYTYTRDFSLHSWIVITSKAEITRIKRNS